MAGNVPSSSADMVCFRLASADWLSSLLVLQLLLVVDGGDMAGNSHRVHYTVDPCYCSPPASS